MMLFALILFSQTAFRDFPAAFTTYGDGDWGVRNGRLEQSKPAYDIAAIQNKKPSMAAFALTVVFERLGDAMGGGLMFNCRNKDKKNDSMMVRPDGDNLLYGHFDDAGVFQPSGSPVVTTKAGKNTLTVVADNGKGRYSVLLNGVRVVTNALLDYTSGYVGVTSSGGPHAFYDLRVESAPAAELSELTSSVIPRPVSVAVGDKVLYVLTHDNPPIQVWSKEGKLLRKIGPVMTGQRKIEIVVDPDAPGKGRLIVDSEKLLLLDAQNGKTLASSNRPEDAVGGTVAYLIHTPMYWWVSKDKQLIMDYPGMAHPRRIPVPKLNKPTCIGYHFGRLYVMDSDTEHGKFETHVFNLDDNPIGAIYDYSFSSWLDPKSVAFLPNGDMVYSGGLGYYESGGTIRVLHIDGSRVDNTSVFMYGTLSRRASVATGADRKIYVADPDAEAVYILGEGMVEPRLYESDPDVQPGQNGSDINIRWYSTVDTGGMVRYGREGTWHTVSAERSGKWWFATLKGLPPNTRYDYYFKPGPRMLPVVRTSRKYTFLTPPPPGKRQAVEVNILTAIYLKTFADGKNHYTIGEEGVLDKVKREFAKGRLFYWRNSRCRFHMKMNDFVIVRDTEAIVNGGWLEPNRAKADLAKMGVDASKYDSLVTVWAEPGFNPNTDDELGAVGGGGLTPYGYSTFGINGRLAWLLTHEYNHQVDAFYDRSGSVKYWLNHPEFTVHPGRFGQHFDCNAFILREWRDDEYFTNEFGKIILYDDKDGDGMPDEDATLPMDEKRFGSDPKKKNTDGDWLDDLGEFMAGIFSATDPTDPKSVRLYSCDPVILQTPMERPIELRSPNTVYPPGSDPSKAPAGSLGTVGITWSSGGLDLTFQLADSKPFRGQIDFDMDNDGWFTGHDNFEFGFDTANSSVRPPGASLTSSGSSFVFHIPASSLGVDTLQDGHMFGLRLRVEQDGKAVSAFDPWTLEPFYLR